MENRTHELGYRGKCKGSGVKKKPNESEKGTKVVCA